MTIDQLALHTHHLTVAYGNKAHHQKILTDINLAINKGEWIGLIGRNGSGKSTLASVISGAQPYSNGLLHIAEDQKMQMVWQNPDSQIVGETVYEEICFGLENEGVATALMPERVQHVLRQVGLSVPPDRPIRDLSGGQKQLLNIASSLAVSATLVIFDEATAMLDPLSRRAVVKLVSQLHKAGLTILWITQWLDELAEVDRVVVIDQGSIVFNDACPRFFYADSEGTVSPCVALGFTPPYVVQVATHLHTAGNALSAQPLSIEALSQVVNSL